MFSSMSETANRAKRQIKFPVVDTISKIPQEQHEKELFSTIWFV